MTLLVENAVLAPEIIWFSPSDEYLEDPLKTLSAIHEASHSKGMLGYVHWNGLQPAAACSGCFDEMQNGSIYTCADHVLCRSYYGVDAEDEDTGVFVISGCLSDLFAAAVLTCMCSSLAVTRAPPSVHGR